MQFVGNTSKVLSVAILDFWTKTFPQPWRFVPVNVGGKQVHSAYFQNDECYSLMREILRGIDRSMLFADEKLVPPGLMRSGLDHSYPVPDNVRDVDYTYLVITKTTSYTGAANHYEPARAGQIPNGQEGSSAPRIHNSIATRYS